jgi:hypothetical protein
MNSYNCTQIYWPPQQVNSESSQTQWSILQNQRQIPTPQGNLPMFDYLTFTKQQTLLKNYYEVLNSGNPCTNIQISEETSSEEPSSEEPSSEEP